LSISLELLECCVLSSFMSFVTYTSWNSSNVFWGVKTFNKLIIWKRNSGRDRGRRERKKERTNYLKSIFKQVFNPTQSHTLVLW